VATELGRSLAERGHEIHFISYQLPFRLQGSRENIFFHEVQVPSYPLFRDRPYVLALANKIVEAVRYRKVELVHVHYAIPHATAAYLAKEVVGGGLKVVTTLHGTDITLLGNDPSFAEIIAFSINKSDAVTAVSEYLRRETLRLFPIQREIKTIYNFVDLEEYRPGRGQHLRRRWVSGQGKLLVHVSNFRRVKRVDAVVRVFHRLLGRIEACLLLVGDGPESMAVRRLVLDLGIEDRVFFLGKQDRVVDIIAAADLMLLPSEQESFGLVALEAMACGVPVVASSVGGLPEVVEDGKTGYLLPPDRWDEMAQKSAEILANPRLHRTMSRQARERSRLFSVRRIVAQYERIYRSLLET